MAFAVKVDTEAQGPEKASGFGKKTLIALLVLDLIALGGWLWLKHAHGPEIARNYRATERGLLDVKRSAVQAIRASEVIVRENLSRVEEPGPLIIDVARALKIEEYISVDSPNTRAWRENSKYNEITVQVSNRLKTGYKFWDLVRFARSVEAKNPKIKIQELDFGSRAKVDKEDTWHPSGKFLSVRAFAPNAAER